MTAHQFSNSVDRLIRLRRLKPKPRAMSIELRASEIIINLCRNMGVNRADVLSDLKENRLVMARFIISHALRYDLGMTLTKVAKALKRDSHATVSHHLRKFDTLREIKDKQFMDLLEKSKKS